MMNLTEQALISQANAFMKASIEKDMAFMRQNLHAQFLFTTPRGTLFSFDSFLSDFMENPKFTIELFELAEYTVFQNTGFGLLNGIIHIRFAGQDDQYERLTMIFLPSVDGWQIISIQGTFTAKPSN